MKTIPVPFRKPVDAAPGSAGSFSREDFITQLTTMTASVNYPLVLAVDGVWGTGKTHMLNTWEIRLKDEGRPYVYFNAWEHDHAEDPFISFVGVVGGALTQFKDDLGKFASALGKISDAVPGMLAIAGRVAANIACKQIGIPADVLEGKTVVDAVQKQIESYNDRHKSIAAFRNELEKDAKSIGDLGAIRRREAASSQVTVDRPPLLVLVDELDRCRPDFAVKLLERVKHIFNVPGIVFVFAVDMGQLQEATRTLYGQHMDCEGYYRRFFDVVIPLPEPDQGQRSSYSEYLFEELKTATIPRVQGSAVLAQSLQCLALVFGLSLRELKQVAALFDLCMRSINTDDSELWKFVLFSVVLRIKRNDVFEQAAGYSLQPASVTSLFRVAGSADLTREPGFDDFRVAVYYLVFGACGAGEGFWTVAKHHVTTLPETSWGRIILESVGSLPRRVDRHFQLSIQRAMSAVAALISGAKM